MKQTKTITRVDRKLDIKIDEGLAVASEDLDDIVEISLRMMDEEEGVLSDLEVREVATELEIPHEYVARAKEELEQKRKRERQAELAKKSRRRTAVTAAAVVIALLCGYLAWGYNSASSYLHEAQSAQAQADNVTEREMEIKRLHATSPNTPDKMAELAGARNRVRVEVKRYNEAATRYNKSVSGPSGWVITNVTSLPGSLQLR